jgi:hypothetical protein
MSDRTLIGVAAPRGACTVRYLHHGQHPDTLLPLLRHIWRGLDSDSNRLAAALLAEDWSYLSTDRQPSGRYKVVPGIGYPSPGGTRPQPTSLRLSDRIEGYIGWLYVLHPDTDIVVVYEATVHDQWLRHGLHHLDPVEEVFVTEPDPHAEDGYAMTVCTVCGAVDEMQYHELPSMVGYGEDTCFVCIRCGSSVTTDPMFGAHVNRKPWPQRD